jgi:hypothetical protein
MRASSVPRTHTAALPFYSGTTNTAAALELAADELGKTRRADSDALVVLLTDGYSFVDAVPAADKLRATARTRLLVVSVSELLWRYVVPHVHLYTHPHTETNYYVWLATTRNCCSSVQTRHHK